MSETRAVSKAPPERPWLCREDWADGRVPCGSGRKALRTWAFALLWNVISAPLCFILPEELAEGNWPALLGLLFPLVGVCIVVAAARATLHWRKFGSSIFELAEVPGRLGGRLAGAIHVDAKILPADGFHLTLRCVRKACRREEGSLERVLWDETHVMARELLERDPRFTSIPVCFDIPADAGPISNPEADPPIVWTLEARARVAGLDFRPSFDVPVYRVEGGVEAAVDSDGASDRRQEDPAAAYRAEEAVPDPASCGIRVDDRIDGGLEVAFRAARNPGAAISASLFTAFLVGATWMELVFGLPVIFPIVTGLVTVLLTFIVFELWFTAARVRIDPERIRIATTHLGIGGVREIRAADVAEIRTSIGMRCGNTPYYDIEIVPAGDRRVYAGRHVRDKRLAEWLVDRMSEAVTSESPGDRTRERAVVEAT